MALPLILREVKEKLRSRSVPNDALEKVAFAALFVADYLCAYQSYDQTGLVRPLTGVRWKRRPDQTGPIAHEDDDLKFFGLAIVFELTGNQQRILDKVIDIATEGSPIAWYSCVVATRSLSACGDYGCIDLKKEVYSATSPGFLRSALGSELSEDDVFSQLVESDSLKKEQNIDSGLEPEVSAQILALR